MGSTPVARSNEQDLRVPRTGADATKVVCRGSSPLAETMRISSSGQDSALPARQRRFESDYPLQDVHGLPSGQAQSCNLCYVSSILTPCSKGLGG